MHIIISHGRLSMLILGAITTNVNRMFTRGIILLQRVHASSGELKCLAKTGPMALWFMKGENIVNDLGMFSMENFTFMNNFTE